jgi:hypothetical protein
LGDKFVVSDAGELISPSIGSSSFKTSAVDGTTLERGTSGALQVADSTDGSLGVDRSNLHRNVGWIKTGSLTASDTAGAVFNVENTTGVKLQFRVVQIDVTTGSTGACTLDIGVGASASTSYDTLMDGTSIAAGGSDVRVHDNIADKGTNGATYTSWPAGEFVTASMASGATAGLVGTYYIEAFYAGS